MADLNQILLAGIERKASDIHIVPDSAPFFRVNNNLLPYLSYEVLTDVSIRNMMLDILTDEQKENFQANREIDFGYQLDKNRFRVNMFHSRGNICVAFRYIPPDIRTLDDLMMPPIFHEFTKFNQGLVLITGPTGEGKSTTLAAMMNEINMTSAKHIITIEDPIEFTFPKGKSIISQRELHQDTFSWNIALRSVLREDPDVVLVGEMRDQETIQAVLTIAETGHLVLSTLHTNSTPDAINRVVDVFPAHQQPQIRNQLSTVLRAVVAQRLIPDMDAKTRIPALEILLNLPATASIIREGKVFMLDNILETEEEKGLILFEKYLTKLFQKGLITRETAYAYALRQNEIKKFIR
ncbi:MAG: PilT/PilU family type 4a pilus ATPase [Candidatus Roizmanbacteria bacterium]